MRSPSAVIFLSSSPDTSALDAGGVRSTQRVSMSGVLPVCLEGWLRVARSGDPSAPAASIQTALILESVEARVTLRERLGGSPREDADVLTMPLVPSGRRLVQPEQTVRGLTDGCRLALRLTDSDGSPLAHDRVVGECREGARELFVPFALRMNVTVWVEVRDWPAGRGPGVRVSGELVLEQGVNARVFCQPPLDAAPRAALDATDIPLLHPGLAFYSPERSIEGRRPGACWVSVSFHDGSGRPSGDERVLGRCVRI
ncbi:MAG TPA: hypothetical protein VJY35_03650 [Candidatus Eisenbacteria bacterium]|nr:hypothetical protein [Candidatus Eisenbacteria bacterium]